MTYFCSTTSHGETHTGKVRDHNEDAFLDVREKGVWVVADGAGGHDQGEVASSLIVQELEKVQHHDFLGDLVASIRVCVQEANQRLINMRRHSGSRGMLASTVCILAIHQQHSVCLWAGDSRIYLLRGEKLSQLTRDHNRIDEFQSAGFKEEEIVKYPAARQLVRAVGVEQGLQLEIQVQECREGDVFLLCSDGLHGEMSDEEISLTLLAHKEPEPMVQALIKTVLTRPARDNVTALLVKISNGIN